MFKNVWMSLVCFLSLFSMSVSAVAQKNIDSKEFWYKSYFLLEEYPTCATVPDNEWINLQACFPDSKNCVEQEGCICTVVCFDNAVPSNDLPCYHTIQICT